MALSWHSRRRFALLILLVGLPLYIVAAVSLVGWIDGRFGRPPIWAELLIYVGLGFLWMLPFRFVFRGIGKAAPETETERPGDRSD